MHQSHMRARPVEIQRSLGSGILTADNHDLLLPEGMRLGVIMRDMRQIFARNSNAIRKIVVPGSNDNLLSFKLRQNSLLVASMHAKLAGAAFDSFNELAQSQFQSIVLSALAIILERLGTCRFLSRTGEGQIADFKKLRRSEEHHIDRIMVERVAQATFIDHQWPQAGA